jgi:hypothetical protein
MQQIIKFHKLFFNYLKVCRALLKTQIPIFEFLEVPFRLKLD